MPQEQLSLAEGDLVLLYELADAIQQARERSGLSPEELARTLDLPVRAVQEAENQPYRGRLKVRKRILEQLTGQTLDGPYFRVVRLDDGDESSSHESGNEYQDG